MTEPTNVSGDSVIALSPRQTARAAGRAAGNRSMRARGSDRWNAADFYIACAVTERVLRAIGAFTIVAPFPAEAAD